MLIGTPSSVQHALLWLTEGGRPVPSATWEAAFRRACARCHRFGIDVDVTPHTFRHTFAVNMLSMLIREQIDAAFDPQDRHGAAYRRILGDPLQKLKHLLGQPRDAYGDDVASALRSAARADLGAIMHRFAAAERLPAHDDADRSSALAAAREAAMAAIDADGVIGHRHPLFKRLYTLRRECGLPNDRLIYDLHGCRHLLAADLVPLVVSHFARVWSRDRSHQGIAVGLPEEPVRRLCRRSSTASGGHAAPSGSGCASAMADRPRQAA